MNKGKIQRWGWALAGMLTACILACQEPATQVEPRVITEDGESRIEGEKVRVSYAFPTGDRATSVILVEKMAPAEIQVGQAFDYQIKVTNLANCELEDVVITDRLPEKFKLQKAVPEAEAVTDNEARWALGTLRPDESKSISVTGVAGKMGTWTACSKVAYRTPLCLTIIAVEPKLHLSKSAPEQVLVCDTIPIRYVVTNAGTGTARNVRIEDTLPEGMETVDGESKVTFEAGDLAAGESREFSANVRASRTGKFTSRGVATGEGELAAEALTTTTVRQPMLTITVDAPKELFIGRNFTYEIIVTNKGDAAAQDAVISDQIPPGTRFVSASDRGTERRGLVTWNIGTLEPNASKTVRMTVLAERIATVPNTATVQGICAARVEASTVTELVGIPAILLEVIDLEDPVEIGNQATYLIMATNQGSADETNIRIVCTLESAMQYVSSSGPTEATVVGNTVRFAPLVKLAPRAKASWRLTVRAVKRGDVRFRARMMSDRLERPVEETEATNFYEFGPAAATGLNE